MPPIMLDLSRLVSRVRHPTPTGIDRVEMAYAAHFLNGHMGEVGFAARLPWLRLLGARGVSAGAARALVAATAARWADAAAPARASAAAMQALGGGARRVSGAGAVTLIVSHHALDRPHALAARLRRDRSRLVVFLHDAIPVEHPEFAKAHGVERHRRRIETAARLAAGIIVNSQATAASIARLCAAAGRVPPIAAIPLGVDPPLPAAAGAVPTEPYFLCVGTIEPRKNHLMLLQLWRAMAAAGGRVPRLMLVGRRGWENAHVTAMLDRCDALRPHVEERGRASDAELAALMRGARALLMPSFAEGYGLPVAEALAHGLPVIASDLSAHREVGGVVPDYLCPMDGAGWRGAILDYATDGSATRAAQVARMAGWRRPTWEAHMAAMCAFVSGLPR